MAASGDLISEADGRFPTQVSPFVIDKADPESGRAASAPLPDV